MAMHYEEYEIYVPTVDAEGQAYSEGIIASIRGELVEFFGGLTDTRQKNEGLWKVGGIFVRDEVVIWKILSDRGGDGEAFIRKTKETLEALLAQEQLLVIRRQVEKID